VLPDWKPSASAEVLHKRAQLNRCIREWFHSRNILEVETPLLVSGATTDPHIDSFQVASRALRTSSEFHQKRLLAAGIGDNYELGKVFRIDESGRHHNPEFTMLEWYRLGIDHHQLIDEVQALLAHLHGETFPGFNKISYRELWQQTAGVDIADCTAAELTDCIVANGVEVPPQTQDFDELLDLGMATFIADAFEPNSYTCVYHYPASQASLARIDHSDPKFLRACRFEVFYGRVELANGYYELTDGAEQAERFKADNRRRNESGKPPMPVDYKLIAALQHGLPECSGVAMGVDRLMMILMPEIDSIDQTISFNWQLA
jgi:lysyl-tRNA synthetase class 2